MVIICYLQCVSLHDLGSVQFVWNMDYWVLFSQHLEMTVCFKIFASFDIMVTIDPVLNTSCLVDKSLQENDL